MTPTDSDVADLETTSAYCLGRSKTTLEHPFQGKDNVIVAERYDEQRIESPKYRHSTFANLGFKKSVFDGGEFLNCVFIGCYFRRAELTGCKFTGCRFVDCNFNHIYLKSCDFRHSNFYRCQIAYAEMEHCLPSEPNLREELTRNLSVESSRLGLSREARQYRIAEIGAREAHLKAAIVGESQWYKEHFDGFGRVQALYQITLSLLNRWLWGYGERASVLIRNFFILSIVIFPILFFGLREQLAHRSGEEIELWDTLYFSLENVTPAGVISNIYAVGSIARLLAALESIFGVVAIALFAAYVFRWSLHR